VINDFSLLDGDREEKDFLQLNVLIFLGILLQLKLKVTRNIGDYGYLQVEMIRLFLIIQKTPLFLHSLIVLFLFTDLVFYWPGLAILENS